MKQPKPVIIHAGTNNAVKFTSRDILNKLLKLKPFIQEKLSDAEMIIFTPTLRSDNSKGALTVRQLTNCLINLKIDILDNRNITGKDFSGRGLHLNQSGSNLLTKNIIYLSCGNFENLWNTYVSHKIDPKNLQKPEILIMKKKKLFPRTSR